MDSRRIWFDVAIPETEERDALDLEVQARVSDTGDVDVIVVRDRASGLSLSDAEIVDHNDAICDAAWAEFCRLDDEERKPLHRRSR